MKNPGAVTASPFNTLRDIAEQENTDDYGRKKNTETQ